MVEEKSQVVDIRLPDDAELRLALRGKLQEYRDRASKLEGLQALSPSLKATLVELLLIEGRLGESAWPTIVAKYGNDRMVQWLFEEGCGIMQSYLANDKDSIEDGTGLPAPIPALVVSDQAQDQALESSIHQIGRMMRQAISGHRYSELLLMPSRTALTGLA